MNIKSRYLIVVDKFLPITSLVMFLTLIAGPVLAQESLPRFESADCPFERGNWARDVKFECKWLLVPEARGNPKSRTIKLAVVILRAKEPDGSPPLVMLHGGPGESGIRIFTQAVVSNQRSFRRDVVIYDQRGAGQSQPRLCPEYSNVGRQSEALKTQKEREKLWDAEDRKCVALLDAQGVERSAYNTSPSAADLIDLRQTLGYATWDIYGGSYGARLAQEAMRRDSKGIRSMILDSPMTRGPTFQAEIALSGQRAFERVFADCSEQPACRAAFPTLEKDFYEVYDALADAPVSVQVEQNPNASSVVLDGRRFLSRIRGSVLGRPGRLAGLPLLINEFRRGDKMRAARLLVGSDPQSTGGGDQVLIHLVNCYDVYGKQFRTEQKAINAQVRAPFRSDQMTDCKLWQKRFADPSEYEPVRSDIPTLILTGRYDDRTPTEHAKRIASTLTRAYLYEFPNEGHGGRPIGCRLSIMNQFMENPFREPDASCISKIQPIKFLTSLDQVPATQNPIPDKNP